MRASTQYSACGDAPPKATYMQAPSNEPRMQGMENLFAVDFKWFLSLFSQKLCLFGRGCPPLGTHGHSWVPPGARGRRRIDFRSILGSSREVKGAPGASISDTRGGPERAEGYRKSRKRAPRSDSSRGRASRSRPDTPGPCKCDENIGRNWSAARGPLPRICSKKGPPGSPNGAFGGRFGDPRPRKEGPGRSRTVSGPSPDLHRILVTFWVIWRSNKPDKVPTKYPVYPPPPTPAEPPRRTPQS